MKILITGGAGFIGSHIVDRLTGNDFVKKNKVIIVDICRNELVIANKRAKFYCEDICNLDRLKYIFKNQRPEVVIHAAAQTNVRESLKDPIGDANTNIMGGLNVLECCKRFGVKKIIYLSTGGALYGEPKYLPVDEKHSLNPLSPYGISKRVFEQYLEIYEIPYVSLRFSNVYGLRDPIENNRVITSFISSFMNDKDIKIYGNGKQKRDFIYVDDVVDAIMTSIKSDVIGVFNIGTEKMTSVNEVFKIIKNVFEIEKEPRYEDKIDGEVNSICLNTQKARKKLKWKPKISLKKGLRKIIEWEEMIKSNF